jgi:cytochrome c-type biogenesis protein
MDEPDDTASDRSAGARYGLLAVAVAVVGLAGYLGYVVYPRFDLPAVEGAALLGLAAAAGIASFFSPCSFPLLLGLLGRQAAARASDDRRATPPVVFGGALALGAAAFMLLLGAAIGVGGEALFADVTFASTPGIMLRGTVGVLLIGLGLVQLGALPSPMHAVERISTRLTRRQARMRRDKPVAGFALFGFGYVLAGFG